MDGGPGIAILHLKSNVTDVSPTLADPALRLVPNTIISVVRQRGAELLVSTFKVVKNKPSPLGKIVQPEMFMAVGAAADCEGVLSGVVPCSEQL